MQLPTVSSLELVAILRRLGFRIVETSDAHTILRRGDDGCVVPHRQRMADGVLRLMLAAASISLLEFLETQGSTEPIPVDLEVMRDFQFIPIARSSGVVLH